MSNADYDHFLGYRSQPLVCERTLHNFFVEYNYQIAKNAVHQSDVYAESRFFQSKRRVCFSGTVCTYNDDGIDISTVCARLCVICWQMIGEAHNTIHPFRCS